MQHADFVRATSVQATVYLPVVFVSPPILAQRVKQHQRAAVLAVELKELHLRSVNSNSSSARDSKHVRKIFQVRKKHELESCFCVRLRNRVAMPLVSFKGDDVIKFHCDTNGFANSVVVVTGYQRQ